MSWKIVVDLLHVLFQSVQILIFMVNFHPLHHRLLWLELVLSFIVLMVHSVSVADQWGVQTWEIEF